MAQESKSEKQKEREERLAKALRDNLRRRKEQTKARSSDDDKARSD